MSKQEMALEPEPQHALSCREYQGHRGPSVRKKVCREQMEPVGAQEEMLAWTEAHQALEGMPIKLVPGTRDGKSVDRL